MAFRQIIQLYLTEELSCSLLPSRFYSSNVDWNKLRPMIHKRIKNRVKDYPLKALIPVAHDVLQARKFLIQGVSSLLKVVPAKACKHCPEVFIGSRGHLIKTCHGFKRIKKDQEHKWINATVNDILNPVEAFHLPTISQPVIKHEQRFDFERIPAVVELCSQAGAETTEEMDQDHDTSGEVDQLGLQTLDAWERLRVGVQKLLLVYSAKVCEHCSEVHIGPSGHKARVCGVFSYEGWRGAHRWKKAEVDDLVPAKVVWHRRQQDPLVLEDSGRGFYGHAPAVVELCMHAGARMPSKYFCMMKVDGLAPNLIQG